MELAFNSSLLKIKKNSRFKFSSLFLGARAKFFSQRPPSLFGAPHARALFLEKCCHTVFRGARLIFSELFTE